MSQTRLSIAVSAETPSILSKSELCTMQPIIVCYDWFNLFSHARNTTPTVIEKIIGRGSLAALRIDTGITLKKKAGTFIFKSPLNGETLSFTVSDLLALTTLFEYIVIANPILIAEFNDASQPFYLMKVSEEAVTEVPQTGRVIAINASNEAIELPSASQKKPVLVRGVFSPNQLNTLKATEVDIIETAQPFLQAQNGVVHTHQGLLDLRDLSYRLDHTPIDAGCDCDTCQHHTKAYLYHLLGYTPLLAIKFLAIHNLQYWVKSIAIH